MKKRVIRIAKYIFYALVIAAVLYIMLHGLGLVDSLDFGAGAYYYADMPGFASLVNAEHYTSPVPMWVLIVLFLAWGAVMFKLWTWLDRKWK